MSAPPLEWPDKSAWEKHRKGALWHRVVGAATIVECDAVVIEGDVVIDAPLATDFEGTVQGIWITGGTPGRQIVRMRVKLSDGQWLEQDFRFWVKE